MKIYATCVECKSKISGNIQSFPSAWTCNCSARYKIYSFIECQKLSCKNKLAILGWCENDKTKYISKVTCSCGHTNEIKTLNDLSPDTLTHIFPYFSGNDTPNSVLVSKGSFYNATFHGNYYGKIPTKYVFEKNVQLPCKIFTEPLPNTGFFFMGTKKVVQNIYYNKKQNSISYLSRNSNDNFFRIELGIKEGRILSKKNLERIVIVNILPDGRIIYTKKGHKSKNITDTFPRILLEKGYNSKKLLCFNDSIDNHIIAGYTDDTLIVWKNKRSYAKSSLKHLFSRDETNKRNNSSRSIEFIKVLDKKIYFGGTRGLFSASLDLKNIEKIEDGEIHCLSKCPNKEDKSIYYAITDNSDTEACVKIVKLTHDPNQTKIHTIYKSNAKNANKDPIYLKFSTDGNLFYGSSKIPMSFINNLGGQIIINKKTHGNNFSKLFPDGIVSLPDNKIGVVINEPNGQTKYYQYKEVPFLPKSILD